MDEAAEFLGDTDDLALDNGRSDGGIGTRLGISLGGHLRDVAVPVLHDVDDTVHRIQMIVGIVEEYDISDLQRIDVRLIVVLLDENRRTFRDGGDLIILRLPVHGIRGHITDLVNVEERRRNRYDRYGGQNHSNLFRRKFQSHRNQAYVED